MRYRLAIFDFDGTLADTFPFFLSVVNRISDQHGFERIALEEVHSLRHKNAREMMRHVGMPPWKLPIVAKSFMGLMQNSTDELRLFDGIEEALQHLAREGVLLAVVSSNSEHNVRKVLGPDVCALFARFDCGMSILGKANRIRLMLRKTMVAPVESIYIGDQGTDAEAAHKAGVAFGAVHWGYAPIEALRRYRPAEEFDRPAALARIAARR